MKIIYITNARLPTEKAHGLATMKICEAFAKMGYDVEIIAPRRINKINSDPFDYYAVSRIFKIKKIPSLDLLIQAPFFHRAIFNIQIFSFSIAALFYIFLKRRDLLKNAVFLSHDHIPLFFLSFFARNIFYDIHDFPKKNFLYRRVISKSKGLTCQNQWKIRALEENFGVFPARVCAWPNGTDIAEFASEISKKEAREKLSLEQNWKYIIYIGHFYSWKGVDTLIASSEFLKDKFAKIILVGGTEQESLKLKDQSLKLGLNNIIFAGFRPRREILLWLKAADVLVLPNTAKEDISKFYTSPMKLFEYMASKRPIVASRIPSITEILNEENSFLAEPDNPQNFAENFEKAFADENFADSLARRAFQDVQKYSWDQRATNIVGFIYQFL